MFFDEISQAAPDPIFGLVKAFQADVRPDKISLMVGIFKDEKLQAKLLPAVQQAKASILSSDEAADYLPIDGLPEFCQHLGALAFGGERWQKHQERIYAAQTVGGTSALRIGADFLGQQVGRSIFIPQPTWANHPHIFERAGLNVHPLPYYNPIEHGWDPDAYFKALEALQPKSIVLFHACCHNPTGCDPTPEEWQTLSAICKRKSLVPLFDMAYQGFGDGLEEDARAVSLFLDEGHEFLVAYSCSKNFSLYCQRVGALFVVGSRQRTKERIGSQIQRIIRALYSNPPSHGARIVLHILKNPNFYEDWQKQVAGMRHRISVARKSLIERLVDFNFLNKHKGMFSYLDLNPSQVKKPIDDYALYTLNSGRISIAGITFENVDAIAERILAVCEP